jgi:hypothetical protein
MLTKFLESVANGGRVKKETNRARNEALLYLYSTGTGTLVAASAYNKKEHSSQEETP